MTQLSTPRFTEADVRPEDVRHVMGHVPTGVAVVTAMTRSGPVGLTVGTLTSVSLEPPLVGFLPARSSTSWPLIAPIGRFCVNVLSESNSELCSQFARSGADKFDGVAWHENESRSPVLEDALAWIDCTHEHIYPAGDHVIVLGRVQQMSVRADGRPLVFCHGKFQRLAGAEAAV